MIIYKLTIHDPAGSAFAYFQQESDALETVNITYCGMKGATTHERKGTTFGSRIVGVTKTGKRFTIEPVDVHTEPTHL